MKLVAESPEEEMILSKAMELLKEKCDLKLINCCSYKEGVEMDMLTFALNQELPEVVYDWTPAQRLTFFRGCRDELDKMSWAELKTVLPFLVENYNSAFQQEKKAFLQAVTDYELFCNLLYKINSISFSSFEQLQALFKKQEFRNDGISTLSVYKDVELLSPVVELNYIKVPFSFNDGKVIDSSVVYAWNDSAFDFSYEFLRPDLEREMKKKKEEQKLDCRINDASSRIKQPENIKKKDFELAK